MSRANGRPTQVGYKANVRGLTRGEVEELPLLSEYNAACAPIAVLFDSSWHHERHTQRQMAALCLRCPLRPDCPERKT